MQRITALEAQLPQTPANGVHTLKAVQGVLTFIPE
jgi:hypothetical protein